MFKSTGFSGLDKPKVSSIGFTIPVSDATKDMMINDDIHAKEVRVVGEDGEQLGIMSVEAAKEAAVLLATAKAEAEQLRAEGEAEYMKILSEAYNNSSKAEFYEFVRSLEAAEKSLAQNGNVLILNQDSPLVELFYGK